MTNPRYPACFSLLSGVYECVYIYIHTSYTQLPWPTSWTMNLKSKKNIWKKNCDTHRYPVKNKISFEIFHKYIMCICIYPANVKSLVPVIPQMASTTKKPSRVQSCLTRPQWSWTPDDTWKNGLEISGSFKISININQLSCGFWNGYIIIDQTFDVPFEAAVYHFKKM